MIGNRIKFKETRWDGTTHTTKEREGVVVDAFTEVSGSVSGTGASILGIGSSKTAGNTSSRRKYKVEYYADYDTKKERPIYEDISAFQLVKIIQFYHQGNQELLEEKIIDKP